MKKIIFGVCICLLSGAVKAQQISPDVVNTSGNSFSNGSAQLAFNVGEAAVTKISTTNNNITQGFLQPVVNGVSVKENSSSFEFVAYPNPAGNELNIRSSNYKESIHVKLIDALGRQVYSGELKNNQLSLAGLPMGIYQLLLLDSDQKIIEHKTITKID